MHSQTKAELIETITGTAAALGKEMFTRRMDERHMEKRAEMEREIAEARAQTESQQSSDESDSTTSAEPGGGGVSTHAHDSAPRAGGAAPAAERGDAAPGRVRQPESADGGLSVDLEAVVEQEDCEMCSAVLDHIRQMDPQRRAIGLADYGRMKRAMEREGTEEAVREVVDESPVLQEAMESIV